MRLAGEVAEREAPSRDRNREQAVRERERNSMSLSVISIGAIIFYEWLCGTLDPGRLAMRGLQCGVVGSAAAG